MIMALKVMSVWWFKGNIRPATQLNTNRPSAHHFLATIFLLIGRSLSVINSKKSLPINNLICHLSQCGKGIPTANRWMNRRLQQLCADFDFRQLTTPFLRRSFVLFVLVVFIRFDSLILVSHNLPFFPFCSVCSETRLSFRSDANMVLFSFFFVFVLMPIHCCLHHQLHWNKAQTVIPVCALGAFEQEQLNYAPKPKYGSCTAINTTIYIHFNYSLHFPFRGSSANRIVKQFNRFSFAFSRKVAKILNDFECDLQGFVRLFIPRISWVNLSFATQCMQHIILHRSRTCLFSVPRRLLFYRAVLRRVRCTCLLQPEWVHVISLWMLFCIETKTNACNSGAHQIRCRKRTKCIFDELQPSVLVSRRRFFFSLAVAE